MRNAFSKWEKLRAKGMWHFIVLYGVLLWGIGTAVLFSLIFTLASGRPFKPGLRAQRRLVSSRGHRLGIFHVEVFLPGA